MRQRFALVALAGLVVVGGIAGAFGLSSSSGNVAAKVGVAGADPDATAGSAQNPSALMRLRELGGKQTVSRSLLRQAQRQAAAAPVSAGSWEYLGPNNIGGRVTDVVVDTSQPNTIFVASAGGGVWKSTDQGSTFTSVWPQDAPQAIGSLARGSDGTLWAGTGEANPSGGGITYTGGGVYKSTDGGATWTNVGLVSSDMIGRIAVDPTNPNRVFVAASGNLYGVNSQRGVFRTDDGGGTWAKVLDVPNSTTGAIDIAIDPSNPSHVLAALWDHKRNDSVRDYGGVGSGLYESSNADAKFRNVTWTHVTNANITTPLPSYDATQSGLNSDPSLGRIGIAIAPNDPTRVYVQTGASAGGDKGFFVSNDGGQTFQTGGKAGNNSSFYWWFGRLFVDPTNKNHLFTADVSLRVSTDGGTTWGQSSGPHADQHGMAWDPATLNASNPAGQVVYLGDDGGVYHSTANGASGSWVHGTNMPFNQEYHVAISQQRPNRIATGLQDNGSNRTYNSPADVADPLTTAWNSFGGGDGHYVAIDPLDDTYSYACSQNASCGGTHDVNVTTTTLSAAAAAGATNIKIASVAGLAPGQTLTIDPAGTNPETVTITTVGTQGATGTGVNFTPALAFAHANGATVNKNNVPGFVNIRFGAKQGLTRPSPGCTTDAPLVLDPTTPSTIYIACYRLERSTDRGATWTAISPDDPNSLPGPEPPNGEQDPLYSHQFPTISAVGVSKSDANTIYAGTDNGRLWFTHDLGVTWTQVSGMPTRWITSTIVDPTNANHAFASFSGFRDGIKAANVYETTKAGSGGGTGYSWKGISGNLPNAPVNMLAYDQPNDTLYAATDLGVFYMENDSKVWTRLGGNLPNTAMEDVKIQASSQQLYVGTFGRGTWRIPLVPGS